MKDKKTEKDQGKIDKAGESTRNVFETIVLVLLKRPHGLPDFTGMKSASWDEALWGFLLFTLPRWMCQKETPVSFPPRGFFDKHELLPPVTSLIVDLKGTPPQNIDKRAGKLFCSNIKGTPSRKRTREAESNLPPVIWWVCL